METARLYWEQREMKGIPMKRKTKEQRYQEAKAALRQRVLDIMAGACSGDDPADPEYFVCVICLPAIVRGVELRLLPEDYKEKSAYLTASTNADQYETAEKLTNFLFEHGIRA